MAIYHHHGVGLGVRTNTLTAPHGLISQKYYSSITVSYGVGSVQ